MAFVTFTEADAVKRALDENSNFVKSALEYTLAIERYEEKGFKERMVENLNTWARSISMPTDWKADPMLDSLPANYKTMQSVQEINKLVKVIMNNVTLIWNIIQIQKILNYKMEILFIDIYKMEILFYLIDNHLFIE